MGSPSACRPLRVGFLTNCLPVGSLAVVWLERGESTSSRIRHAHLGSPLTKEARDHHDRHRPAQGNAHGGGRRHEEAVVGEHKLRASATQAAALIDWAQDFGSRTWAVESAAGLGYLLAQQLVAAGETVVDVPPVLAARVRIMGSGRSQKNDPNDARSVAIAALRSNRLAQVCPDDHARVLGLLAKRHRDMARLRNTHCSRLHALLGELHPGGVASEMTVTKAKDLLSGVEAVDEVTRCRLLIAAELVDDIARLDASLKASKKRVKVAVLASGTTVTDVYGIGPISAAMIIGHVRRRRSVPDQGPLRHLQRHRSHRGVLGRP